MTNREKNETRKIRNEARIERENKIIEEADTIKSLLERAGRAMLNTMQAPKFTGKHVPVSKAAQVMGKASKYICEGIKRGVLPIGCAIPTGVGAGGMPVYTYYISPRLLWEYTGAVVEGEETGETIEEEKITA